MNKAGKPVNVLLGKEDVAQPERLANQTHQSPEALARSLLSRALDQAEPSANSVTAVLDSMEGAFEKAQAGTADVNAGRFVRLDDL